MVKLYNISNFLMTDIKPNDYIEIECGCGYLLGYSDKKDLIPTGEPMFECPKCAEKFDFLLK